ncbi:MAG: VOC family protein, partial [Candidatus Dormibacteraceae bacterium]
SLMFAQENVNKAEQAINFYTSIFHDAKSGNLARYEKATGPAKKGSLAYGDFQLEGEWFAAMDSGVDQDFTFSEAISLMVNCQTQAEIDDLWTKLSAVPESEQCGWLKDKYGVSWQITPANMDELMKTPGAFARMMKMHKLDIAGLQSE